MSEQRPKGLTALAIINFVFAFMGLGYLAILIIMPEVQSLSGYSSSVYAILSPTLTSILLIVSGIGFIRVSYGLGFIGGIVFTCVSILNTITFSALQDFNNLLLQMPGMLYPILLLILLIFKYRDVFVRTR